MTPHDLAVLAQRAYDEPPTFSAGGVEVLFIDDGRSCAFVFRGTDRDGHDILTDLKGCPWRFGMLGWCHRGFGEGVEGIWPKLSPKLATMHGLGRVIHFTGHSKGGAEATVGAAIATLEYGAGAFCLVTFGSPRVGFKRLGKILVNVPGERFVRGKDAVTTHPYPLWGYRHVGDPIAIGTPRDRWKDHKIAGYIEDVRVGGGRWQG